MSAKNLEIHSWPLILLSVALLTLSVSWGMAMRDDQTLAAMTRPSLAISQTGDGLATIKPNEPTVIEQPGMTNQIPADPAGMIQANLAGRSLALQIAVDQSVKQAAQPVYKNKTSR